MSSFSDPEAVARYAEGPVRLVPGFHDLQRMAAMDDRPGIGAEAAAGQVVVREEDELQGRHRALDRQLGDVRIKPFAALAEPDVFEVDGFAGGGAVEKTNGRAVLISTLGSVTPTLACPSVSSSTRQPCRFASRRNSWPLR